MPYRFGAPLDTLIRQSWPLRNSHGASAFWVGLTAQLGAGAVLSLDSLGWYGFPSAGTYEDGVAWIVLVLAQAVSYIHSRRVIHCDIKPSNVYVAVRDGPLLFDFGFARSPEARDPLPGGTLAYMAPEQLRACVDPQCWAEVGPAVDTYSLGLTMVELLLGAPPDVPHSAPPAHQTTGEWLSRRLRPDWLDQAISGRIPSALEAIVGRCLAPAPKERYNDVGHLVQDLARFIASSRAWPVASSTLMAGPPKFTNWSPKIVNPMPSVLTAPPAATCSPDLQVAL
jgi:serine/threonine protein kinase